MTIGTRERSRPAWFARHSRDLPKGLLGSILSIIVLNGMGVVHDAPGRQGSADRLRASWLAAERAASGPEASCDVLCFGDSLIKLGVLPRVIENRLGGTAYNLAVLGGQAPHSYCLLRHVLERGHRPRALVINFSPLLLGMDPRVNLEWWSRRADGRELEALAWRTGDPALIASIAVPMMVPSWSARDAARAALGLEGAPAPRGGGRAVADDQPAFERNWRLNRGAQVAPRHFVPIEGSLPKPYLGTRWKWRPHPAHAFYVDRFLGLAQAHQVPVYWVLTPAMSTWLDRNDGAGTLGAYRQYVRNCLERFSSLTVLDAQRVGWDRSTFRDPIHLNRDGAARLSLAVADAIATTEARPAKAARWLELNGNAYRHSDTDQCLLEDLDQSRLAVNQPANGPDRGERPK